MLIVATIFIILVVIPLLTFDPLACIDLQYDDYEDDYEDGN